MENNIIYLDHPVSAEQKAEAKSSGKKIIDSFYKPAEAKKSKQKDEKTSEK